MGWPDRFWSKVDKSGDCWNWTAYKCAKGYGVFTLNGKHQKAHRVSYILTNGEFDKTLFVCHKCDNPSCVNPQHLFLGTNCKRYGRTNVKTLAPSAKPASDQVSS